MHWGLLVVGLVETRRRRREREVDDVDALSDSRFAPGVSILVPAYNESAGLPDAVRSLLAIEYPEFEVIVVNDGSTDDTLERLVDELGLVPVDAAGRDVVETEPVIGYYRSPSDPRLLVVDKLNGGKADALNAGLNHSRYRYVCAVDADMVFARGSLSRAMREIVRDPEVVGLTSYFENARDPARVAPGRCPLRRARDAAALRLPDLRLPPGVLQQPDRVGPAQLHAVRRRRVPDLAPRPGRGARRLVARRSPARTSSSRSASTRSCASAGAPYRDRVPPGLRGRHRGARTRCGSSSPSASAGSA